MLYLKEFFLILFYSKHFYLLQKWDAPYHQMIVDKFKKSISAVSFGR